MDLKASPIISVKKPGKLSPYIWEEAKIFSEKQKGAKCWKEGTESYF